MIFKAGYLPFKETYRLWLDHVIKHKQMMADDRFFSDEGEGTLFLMSALELFCDEILDGMPVFIIRGEDELIQIIGAVCRYTSSSILEGDFPTFGKQMDLFYGNDCEDSESEFDIDILEMFFELPNMQDLLFPFINPHFSVIDCRVDSFIRYLIEADDDPLRYRQLETKLSDHDGPILEAIDTDEFQELIALRDMEMGYEWNKRTPKSPFEKYNGESICFSTAYLEKHLNSEYPLKIDGISRSISNETAAEKAFRSYMSSNPEAMMSKEIAAQLFFKEIGARASKRVWDKVTHDFPSLRLPGRKRDYRDGVSKR